MKKEKKGEEPQEKLEKEAEPEGILVQELQDLQGYKEKYMRLLADSENTRKRMQKERQDLTKYAVENAIVEFLHPIDHFEKALGFAESMSDEVKNWAIGFEMILEQFKQVLVNHGIMGYPTVGKTFDPHLHEAVEMVETADSSPNTILEECVRGYKMGERIIRVAKVKVAKAPQNENQTENIELNENIQD